MNSRGLGVGLMAYAVVSSAAQVVRPSDVVARPSAYDSTVVEWQGRLIRSSRIPRSAPAINQRLFVAVDPLGLDLPGQWFVADGPVEETEPHAASPERAAMRASDACAAPSAGPWTPITTTRLERAGRS